MKSCQSLGRRPLLGIFLAKLIISACLLSVSSPAAEDAKPKKEDPASKPTGGAPKKGLKKPAKKLNGAELYALHCNRCHPERYATERTADQWKTILLHMRTRANLPADQANAILQFLQEDSGK